MVNGWYYLNGALYRLWTHIDMCLFLSLKLQIMCGTSKPSSNDATPRFCYSSIPISSCRTFSAINLHQLTLIRSISASYFIIANQWFAMKKYESILLFLITNNMMWRRWRRRQDMFCNVFLWTVVDIFFYNQPMVFRYRNNNNLDIVAYATSIAKSIANDDDEIWWWDTMMNCIALQRQVRWRCCADDDDNDIR